MRHQKDMESFKIIKTRSVDKNSYVDLIKYKGKIVTQIMTLKSTDQDGISRFKCTKSLDGNYFDTME